MSLRVLLFSSLFPSIARPRHGIFVETRLRQLVREGGVDARVIAPVPWFPSRAAMFGSYASMAATPRRTTRDNGVQVAHPRYLMLPKLGVPFQPDSMARTAMTDVLALRRAGWTPQIIDAHYFYPDGVAAALLAERLGLPFIVTARGTDINVLGQQPMLARRIVWAAERASAVVAVSARLKEALEAMGVSASKIVVLRNGVDLDLFAPQEMQAARARLGLPGGRLAACVGNLVPEKGQSLAIDAMARLGDAQLVVVGDGPMRAELQQHACRLGVHDRVRFLNNMPQTELRHLYAAVDALLLPSTREGWPNVVLEALACGTPVVASDVGAVADMLTAPNVGRIVGPRDAQAFAAALTELWATPTDREAIRRHAAQFDWASISRAQIEIFTRALAERRAPDAAAVAASTVG